MKKKIILRLLCVVMCISMLIGGGVSAFAASSLSTADILVGLLGGGPTSVNVTEFFADWLTGVVTEEGPIDKIIANFKDEINGVADEVDDPEADEEELAVIDKAEAGNIADLFNITVNEIKKGAPSFVKTEMASVGTQLQSELKEFSGVINGMVASLITDKDFAAAVIEGVSDGETTVKTVYGSGNDVKNNVPVTGKDYVACITAEDIKDYTITVYRSGAYKMRIDLVDADGASSETGLAHAFDTSDKAYATLDLLGAQINIGIRFKYVGNYLECSVNKNGEITSYTQHMGITFMFEQEDGTYSTTMPYLGIDFMEKGVVYELTTEFSNIDFALRKMGDYNNDGKVNSTDARSVLRVSAGLDSGDSESVKYSDVSGDGKVNSTDARLILRGAAGLDTLPTTSEALGLPTYAKSESTQKQIEDLLILIIAYQNAKDAQEQQRLEDYYNDKYSQSGTESTTVQEETTTGNIQTTGDKIDSVIGGIADVIGGLIKK